MKVQTNHVLVLPDESFLSRGGIAIGDEYDPMKHVAVTGEVLGVGPYLYCKSLLEALSKGPQDPYSQFSHLSSMCNEFSMPFDTIDEINIGDRVMFHYINHLVAQDEGVDIFIEGRQVLLIPRYQLYMKLFPLTPLNGYVFIEPDERVQENIFINKGDSTPGIGVVKFSGLRYLSLLDPTPTGLIHPRQGDRVVYKSSAPSVEYKYHQVLNTSGRPLVRAQAHEILAIME